jgi:shikimate kinase
MQNPKIDEKHITLIGYMGSGKSTVGKQLSLKLSYAFVDLDKAIEAKENLSVTEIFEQKGEPYFRTLEAELLGFYLSKTKIHIISTGGGTPCNDKNIELILNKSHSVFLNVSIQALTNRLKDADKDKRPLLKSISDDQLFEFIQEKINARLPYYSRCHQEILIDDKTSMNRIIQEILEKL